MGGQQSSATGGEREGAVSKTCYYDLLEVDQTAPSDDIRRAYRRKALELHPDKNPTDVENATQRFAEVQTAYEILSDPQERAWYDSHRDAILQNQDVDGSAQDASQYRNVRITSSEDIISLVGRFNAAVPFTDEPTGFYGSLREIFDQLAAEEAALGDHDDRGPISYPPYGTSTSDYDTVVKPFYNGWAGFSTRKTFAWKDKYRLSDAPDRRVRRLLEKENRKCREDAIREFNDSVRFLLGFSKKRDPRFIPNTQSVSDRQKALRDAVAAQAARSRAANQEKLAESIMADWTRPDEDDGHADEFPESDEETPIEEIECVVCRKFFKSENQYQAHERSKKHIKAVQQLRRDMRRENKNLGLDSVDTQPASAISQGSVATEEPSVPVHPLAAPLPGGHETTKQHFVSDAESISSSCGQHNPLPLPDDRAVKEEENELPANADDKSPSSAQDADVDDAVSTSFASVSLDEEVQASKVGKAKARRAKKAARQAASGMATDSELTCQVCAESFTSRTKLFAHIRETKHAAPRQQVPRGPAKKPKKSGST